MPPDDRPGPQSILLINPHDHEVRQLAEFEAQLDDRPLWHFRDRAGEIPVELLDSDGQPMPFQRVPLESNSMTDIPWRVRVVTPVVMPPRSSKLVTLGYAESPKLAEQAGSAGELAESIAQLDRWAVSASPGDPKIDISFDGRPLLGGGLSVCIHEDTEGSWGEMNTDVPTTAWPDPLEVWKVATVRSQEAGPLRSVLWARLVGTSSRIDLSFRLARRVEAVQVDARLLWTQRSRRVKLVMSDNVRRAEFEVPGGVVTREGVGEVPGNRWVRVHSDRGFCFASDALYSFDLERGALRATIVRSPAFCRDNALDANADPWLPGMDLGEHRFRFLLAPIDAPIERLATELEQPLIVQTVPGRSETM
jgi:alpha-mannosidase